ncbi:hypothetical protein [Microcoleus sp. EPA2]|uniref:hypothetical protein n=1 Tax=Microcoleus sp. EPA2 TaxID=2841654 RepID=UPI00312B2B35
MKSIYHNEQLKTGSDRTFVGNLGRGDGRWKMVLVGTRRKSGLVTATAKPHRSGKGSNSEIVLRLIKFIYSLLPFAR